MSVMPTPEGAPEVAKQLADIWRVLRNAFVHGAAVPGDRFLPGGLAPTGAQVMPDGKVIVFGERDSEGHYPSFYVPNVVAKEQRSCVDTRLHRGGGQLCNGTNLVVL